MNGARSIFALVIATLLAASCGSSPASRDAGTGGAGGHGGSGGGAPHDASPDGSGGHDASPDGAGAGDGSPDSVSKPSDASADAPVATGDGGDDGPRDIPGNLVTNGSFTQGDTHWHVDVHSGVATSTVSNGQLCVTFGIGSGFTLGWPLADDPEVIMLSGGTAYEVSFQVSLTGTTMIGFEAKLGSPSTGEPFFDLTGLDPGAELQTFAYAFTATADAAAGIAFNISSSSVSDGVQLCFANVAVLPLVGSGADGGAPAPSDAGEAMTGGGARSPVAFIQRSPTSATGAKLGKTVTVFDDASTESTTWAISAPTTQVESSALPAGFPAASTFLADLAAVGDLSAIQTSPTCPASDIYPTLVIAAGAQSGDLECLEAPSSAAMALTRDAEALAPPGQ